MADFSSLWQTDGTPKFVASLLASNMGFYTGTCNDQQHKNIMCPPVGVWGSTKVKQCKLLSHSSSILDTSLTCGAGCVEFVCLPCDPSGALVNMHNPNMCWSADLLANVNYESEAFGELNAGVQDQWGEDERECVRENRS